MTDFENGCRRFKDMAEFADRLVAMLSIKPTHTLVIYDAVRSVLEAHVLTLAGRSENAELILSVAYNKIRDCFPAPKESWNMIMRISTALNSFAESSTESDADVIIAAKCLRSGFLGKLLWWQKNTSAYILIEHIRMLRPDLMKIAASILRERNICYYSKVGICIHLIVPVCLNVLVLGVWTEPHSFWLRLFATVPCFSWIIALTGLIDKLAGSAVNFDFGFGAWICFAPVLIMLTFQLSANFSQLDESKKKIEELHSKLRDEISRSKGART